MTTTVRILGSRAREQVPGTGITLHAPGFRGSLTQLPPDPTGDTTPPFADAALGADLKLAAPLAMHLEVRPPDDGPELRSRSAVAAFPRLIVPRRNGIAYALLQTDESGTAAFVQPWLRDDGETVFPLAIARDGVTRRTLRVLMWPAQSVLAAGPADCTARWERLRRAYRLVQWNAGQWVAPDIDLLDRGPCLLLLHDIFGTPDSSFADWLGDESFARVLARYEGRCLAFAHPTLATTVEGNLAWLADHLPSRQSPLDVVAHGRGGLVARGIARELRWPLRRAVLVGTPNSGTPLAAPGALARFIDGTVARLAQASASAAAAPLEGAMGLARFVAMGIAAPLAGLDDLAPASPLLQSLGPPPAGTQWFTVGARHGGEISGTLDIPDPAEFSATDNDLVVPSEGCHLAGAGEALRLEGGVHHHSYFTCETLRARLDAWLG